MATITTPDALKGYSVKTVNFEDIAGLDGAGGFGGPKVGQPYANIGLTFASASVSANANLKSSSGGVAVRSEAMYADDSNSNSMAIFFSKPQEAVGFFYRDLKATSFKLWAADTNYTTIEEGTFQAGEGYAGFIRDKADIKMITTLAPHDTYDDAYNFRTYIDDLSFVPPPRLSLNRLIIPLAWVWTILIGCILITPIGPFCIACDSPISSFWDRFLGIGTLVLGSIGLWREITRQQLLR